MAVFFIEDITLIESKQTKLWYNELNAYHLVTIHLQLFENMQIKTTLRRIKIFGKNNSIK